MIKEAVPGAQELMSEITAYTELDGRPRGLDNEKVQEGFVVK
jgi:hypothetical protein